MIAFDLFAQTQDFLVDCRAGDDVLQLDDVSNVLLGEGVKLFPELRQHLFCGPLEKSAITMVIPK
jgi:hypothetical protein